MSKAFRMYHNPNCSKSRQTLALLEENGIKPEVVLYLESPPTAAELKTLSGQLGLSPGDFLRKKDAKELGIDPETLNEADLIAAMVKSPKMIERPIVVCGDKAVLGRPPENVLSLL